MNNGENQVVRLTVQAKLEYLPGAVAFIRAVITRLGLPEADCRRLELAVEEACVNVIEYAFADENGDLDIIVCRRPGQIVVAIEDRGLPLDFKQLAEGQESGLGIVLMKALADEVNFLNLGRQGKRVELIKYLAESVSAESVSAGSVAAGSANKEQTGNPAVGPAISSSAGEDVSVRLMRPDESIQLARCAYRCYGYTYSTDNFYYPERVSEMIASGLMLSVVALNSSGDIIGHVSIIKENPDSRVGEMGQAIVDPRSRGGGLLKKMGACLSAAVTSRGLIGSYAEAVTVHPFSQKYGIAEGGRETGILIGFTPATMYFKAIQGEGDRKRRSALFFYTRRNQEPYRQVYLPAHHDGVLRRIYDHSGLNREFITGLILPELSAHSRVNVKVQTEASRAFLRVVEYGSDLEDVIRFRLKELCIRRVDCIFLDLPLASPLVQRYCAAMEMLGFFFGCVIPEVADGDILRLQYLNNADVEFQDIQLATDFARELYEYVVKAGGLSRYHTENPPY